MSRRQKWGDEFKQYSLLGQTLANKLSYLPDYACNANALKLVVLDFLLEKGNLSENMKNRLKMIREALKRKGEALWIMNADILTNLALKVGKKKQRFDPEG